jgi:hypothetical protein
LILLGDFGSYERQRDAWERVVDARWVMTAPPRRPEDGVGWPMPLLAWQAAVRREPDSRYTHRRWNDVKAQLADQIAPEVSDEIVARARGVSRQAVAKQRRKKRVRKAVTTRAATRE